MIFLKILVTGASGLVGFEISEQLSVSGHDVVAAYFQHSAGSKSVKLDIGDEDSMRSTLEQHKPDWVIHCAALTNVDECEKNPEKAFEMNGNASGRLARIVKKQKAKIAYISTSFVFGGAQEKTSKKSADASLPLKEDATPAPINEYGKSKLEGEKQIIASGARHLILRIDQPYGWAMPWQKSNMVTWTLDKFAAKEPFSIVYDWYNQPVYLGNFAPVCARLIEKDAQGIFHCAGGERISRYDWAQRIGRTFGCDLRLLTKSTSATLNLPAKRPDVLLDNSKAEKLTGIKMMGIDAGLAAMKKNRPAAANQ